KYDEARRTYQRVADVAERTLGPAHYLVAAAHNGLGNVALKNEDFEAALGEYRRAHEILVQATGAASVVGAMALGNVADALRGRGREDEARATYEAALAIEEKVLGAEHAEVGRILLQLGGVSLDGGRTRQARPYLERALRLFEKIPDHPLLLNVL